MTSEIYNPPRGHLKPGPPGGPPGPAPVVAVAGNLDSFTGKQLQAQVRVLSREHNGDVVLNLGGVSVITAAGVGVLVDLTSELGSIGKRLALVSVSEPALRALREAQATATLHLQPTDEPVPDLPNAGVYGRLARVTVVTDGLRAALIQVIHLTSQALPGDVEVSIILGSPEEPSMIVATSQWAQTQDGSQQAVGAGPSFDAHRSGAPASRRLAEAAACQAFPLLTAQGSVVGVLTAYGRAGLPVGDAILDVMDVFSARAETLLADGEHQERLTTTNEQLQRALTSRAVIDQAKGILMEQRRCDADSAFAYLKDLSNHHNVKLRTLAESIVTAAARR